MFLESIKNQRLETTWQPDLLIECLGKIPKKERTATCGIRHDKEYARKIEGQMNQIHPGRDPHGTCATLYLGATI